MKKSILLAVAGQVLFGNFAECALPDAGSITREQKPQREAVRELPAKEKISATELSESVLPVSIKVGGFRFEAYEGIASEFELQSLVSDSIGKTLSGKELQALVGRVTAYLRGHGWFLARAYLPEQELTDGIVTVRIIQGKNEGGIAVDRDASVRIGDGFLKRMVRSGAKDGEALNLQNLERTALLVNDLPGVSAHASIEPGRSSGTSAVRFGVSEGPVFSGLVWSDNYGNRYTGMWRGNAMVMVNDPLRIGDQLSMLFDAADGLSQGRVGYSLPIGYDGLRGSVAWTGMRYKLGEELKDLDYKGDSSILETGLSYPMLRSRKSTLTASAGYADKNLRDRQAGEVLHDRRVKSFNFGLDGIHFDGMLGGGTTSWNFGVTHGDFHEANELSHADALANGTEGDFGRFNLGLSRLQRLADRMTLSVAWSAQFAENNLGSSEKFYLGGPNGVRAYPVGEAGGDCGHLFNTELKYQLPLPADWGTVQAGMFYDAGRITINSERYPNDVQTATGRNSYWLQGTGVSLDWLYAKRLMIRCVWAHAIGKNSGRNPEGMNADGKSDESRFWLQSIYYF